MEPTNKICKNCETPFKVTYEFCPHCGQKSKEDLTIGVLFYNTISNYFSFDARFFRSFIPLMFKPGYIAKEFVKGKRLQYLHPAQYYLFVSVIFFFILSFKVNEFNRAADEAFKKGFELEKKVNIDKEPIIDSLELQKIKDSILMKQPVVVGLDEKERRALDSTLKANISDSSKNSINFGYDTKKLDSLIAIDAPEKEQLQVMGLKEDSNFLVRSFFKHLLKFHKQKGAGIVGVFFDTVPIALFFLLPIFAFILKIFYWRRGSYSHHLVFSFYYFSYLFIILGLLIGINYFIDIPGWIEFIVVLSTFFYLWLSMKRFYEQGYFVTFIKTGFATFVYMMLIFPATFLLMAATILFY